MFVFWHVPSVDVQWSSVQVGMYVHVRVNDSGFPFWHVVGVVVCIVRVCVVDCGHVVGVESE